MKSSSLSVAGAEYTWHVHREPQWCGADGWRGFAFFVEPVDGSRPLIIETPFKLKGGRFTPHKQKLELQPSDIARFIKEALVAGWKPQSRGKPFVYETGA